MWPIHSGRCAYALYALRCSDHRRAALQTQTGEQSRSQGWRSRERIVYLWRSADSGSQEFGEISPWRHLPKGKAHMDLRDGHLLRRRAHIKLKRSLPYVLGTLDLGGSEGYLVQLDTRLVPRMLLEQL